MNRKTKIIVAAAAVTAGLTAVGTGMAVAGQSAEDEAPITGSALDQASAAALAHTGGGQVTDTEVGDEESLYEVEVTLESGGEVDVQLDESFSVVDSEAESKAESDSGEGEGGQSD